MQQQQRPQYCVLHCYFNIAAILQKVGKKE